MSTEGVLPDEAIKQLAAQGAILTAAPFDSNQIQPASLDLRLGSVAYRIRASFLPGKGVEAVYEAIRARIPHLARDRYLKPEVSKVRELIRSGAIINSAEEAVGKLV